MNDHDDENDSDESKAANGGGNGELDALIRMAGKLDAEQAAQAPGAMAEAEANAEVATLAQTNGQGVAMIMEMALPVLGALYPSLNTVYTTEARAAIAGSLGPVLAKYGINLQEWGGRYQEEIGALFVCGPIAWATVQAVKTDIAARQSAQGVAKAEPAKVEGKAPPAPAGGLVPGDYGYRETVAVALGV